VVLVSSSVSDLGCCHGGFYDGALLHLSRDPKNGGRERETSEMVKAEVLNGKLNLLCRLCHVQTWYDKLEGWLSLEGWDCRAEMVVSVKEAISETTSLLS
jgi:hypothetical protein